MTTNAIDLRQLKIASDSRWSAYHGDHFCFVDDTGFEKIAVRNFGGIICAGDAALIEGWRRWFYAPLLSPQYPATESDENGVKSSIDITFLASRTGSVVFNRGNYIVPSADSMFAGSGAYAAQSCFAVNGCVLRCVTTAASVDMHTGGRTVYWNVGDGSHNLHWPPQTIAQLYQDFEARGSAMSLTTKKIIPMSEYLATVPAPAAPNAAKLGEFNLSAPTGKGYQPWSADEKARLDQAVHEMIRLQQESEG